MDAFNLNGNEWNFTAEREGRRSRAAWIGRRLGDYWDGED